MKDIPFKVQWAWAMIHCVKFVGQAMYEEIHEIIQKYPQYFVWEHTYTSIPSEVHAAYQEEYNVLLETLHNEVYPHEIVSSHENFIGYFKWNSEFEEKSNRMKEELWKKHYGKYKLKYRNE